KCPNCGAKLVNDPGIMGIGRNTLDGAKSTMGEVKNYAGKAANIVSGKFIIDLANPKKWEEMGNKTRGKLAEYTPGGNLLLNAQMSMRNRRDTRRATDAMQTEREGLVNSVKTGSLPDLKAVKSATDKTNNNVSNIMNKMTGKK
ncbi:MAG: hypothetical protein IJS68_01895, partial [Clostridia bacterium]|nr:hypothetical protein [Clostridia bacterium]